MKNNLSDILLWIESPDNFNKGIGSYNSVDKFKKYSELISTVISKPVHEWVALGKEKMDDSYSLLLEMRNSISSLINHFENQEDYYEKDHYESIIGQPHVYDAIPPKRVSDERLKIMRQEKLEKEKKAVENVRKNKDAILWELHTKRVILNTWERELIDQMRTIKRSIAQLKLETNTTNSKLSAPAQQLTTYQRVEMSFKYMSSVDLRTHRQILSESELQNLNNWVTNYFKNSLVIPRISTPISRINTAKGNVVTTFKRLFKEILPATTFPDSLFLLIKACFHQYRDDNIENLKKTKEPDNYLLTISRSE